VLLNRIDLKPGELGAVKAGEAYQVQQVGDEAAVLFKSFVP
jgi:hypothetical protein